MREPVRLVIDGNPMHHLFIVVGGMVCRPSFLRALPPPLTSLVSLALTARTHRRPKQTHLHVTPTRTSAAFPAQEEGNSMLKGLVG